MYAACAYCFSGVCVLHQRRVCVASAACVCCISGVGVCVLHQRRVCVASAASGRPPAPPMQAAEYGVCFE